jgi:hypothetical protein
LANVRVRKLGAAAVALLAVAALSSCDSKVGQAAVVQGHRLSDADLATYIKPAAKSYSDSSGVTVYPKLFVLERWISDHVFEQTVESRGGAPTSDEQRLTRAVVLGTSTTDKITAIYGKLGYTPRFTDLAVHEQQMIVLLVKRLAPKIRYSQIYTALQNKQVGAAVLAAVQKAKVHVSVSARYGSWNPNRLSLTESRGSGLPSFVSFLPGAASTTG